jgi:hypothetical protein
MLQSVNASRHPATATKGDPTMPDDLPEKLKQSQERAKEAIDREDDKLEQVAERAEPHLHEAGERWAKAEREAAHPDEHEHH